jgi:hypothetical protein
LWACDREKTITKSPMLAAISFESAVPSSAGLRVLELETAGRLLSVASTLDIASLNEQPHFRLADWKSAYWSSASSVVFTPIDPAAQKLLRGQLCIFDKCRRCRVTHYQTLLSNIWKCKQRLWKKIVSF